MHRIKEDLRRSAMLSAAMLLLAMLSGPLLADDDEHLGSATGEISTTAVAICTAPTAIEAFRIDPTGKAESQGPKIRERYTNRTPTLTWHDFASIDPAANDPVGSSA